MVLEALEIRGLQRQKENILLLSIVMITCRMILAYIVKQFLFWNIIR